MNQSDIKILKSESVNNSDSNGGGVDFASEIVSGIKFNLFPRVTSSERESGITRYRKIFMTNFNDAGETAYGASICLSSPGNAQDRFYIKKATKSDEQSAVTDGGWGGCGKLAFDASAGAGSIQVLFKNNDYVIEKGALLLIKDSANTHNIRVLNGDDHVSWSGNIATIKLDGQLPENFSAGESYVGVMIEGGDLKPELKSANLSSVAGNFDQSKLNLTNRGTTDDTFSVTFQSAIDFSVSGVKSGDLPSGSISSLYAPLNSKTNQPFFKIPADCWSGTFEAGNTLTIKTTSASFGVWIKEVVPAGCPHEPDNSFDIDWQID